MRIFVLFLILLISCASAEAPKLAPRIPWYETEQNLLKKEKILEEKTFMHVTEQGLLLYRAKFPWGNEQNYQESHNIADQPAWQGYLMAALAFKEAATGEDQDNLISFLATGLLFHYKITGIEGLFGRAIFPGYTGPRLHWMADENSRDTRFWAQGPTGEWWRNGVAKDHLNLAIFGCTIPLILDRQNKITLNPLTKKVLIAVMVPAIKRLLDHDLRIVDYDGRITEFGNLSEQVINGFNMMLVLHMLKSVASLREEECTPSQWQTVIRSKQFYDGHIGAWSGLIRLSLQASGEGVRYLIGEDRGELDKPSFSDVQALGAAFLSLSMQETNREHMKDIRGGMSGWWKFVQYENNPIYAFPYVFFVRPLERWRLTQVITDLRDFPILKYEALTSRKDTKYIQPLANRPLNSNYWKSSPFVILGFPPQPYTEDSIRYAAMDYLLAYWMGRYLNLVPEE